MKPYYQDEWCTIYHGDCREVLPSLGKADLILTDPPYGVLDEGWDDLPQHELTRFTLSWLSLACQKTDRLLTFAPSTRNEIETLCRSAFASFRRLIWDKGSSATGDDKLWYVYEEIYLCSNVTRKEVVRPKNLRAAAILTRARKEAGLSKGAVDMIVRGKKTGLCYRWEEACCLPTPEQVAKLRTVLSLGRDFDSAMAEAVVLRNEVLSEAKQSASANGALLGDVFRFPAPATGVHVCEKPVPLLGQLITLFSGRGSTVLDPFMGSGTTLRAAKDFQRLSIGIEADERHCETAARRLQQEVLAL